MILSRNKLFITIFGILFLFCFLNRTNKIIFWETTNGEIAGTHQIMGRVRYSTRSKVQFTHPEIEFVANNVTYIVDGEENVVYAKGEKVNVIYNPKNPQEANIYSFMGFWWEILFFTLMIPGFILGVAVFSFVGKNDSININLKKFSIKIIRDTREEDANRKFFYKSVKRKKLS